MAFTLTESESPKFCVGGIAIQRDSVGELGVLYRFETEDGFILVNDREIKQMVRDRTGI